MSFSSTVFAAPALADHAERVLRVDVEVDALEDRLRPELDRHPAQLNDRFRRIHYWPPKLRAVAAS